MQDQEPFQVNDPDLELCEDQLGFWDIHDRPTESPFPEILDAEGKVKSVAQVLIDLGYNR